MDQFAPSFQDFVQRTPPISNNLKPLPPPPLIPRRFPSSSPSCSRSPAPFAVRRSSSVYSRTVSQWDSDHISWHSADFEDDSSQLKSILLPLAFSASTPHLVEKQLTSPPCQPRRYSTSIRAPSPPTASEITTPEMTREEHLTVWPSFVQQFQATKNYPRNVSLEEAKAAFYAPGAIHLLPEELRAKTTRRPRSQEALRITREDVCPPVATTGFPESVTFVDNQGRRRTIISPKQALASFSEFPSQVLDSSLNDGRPALVSSGHEREMAPLVIQQRQSSKEKVVKALGLDDFDEPRGRTRHRGPRKVNHAHYSPTSNGFAVDYSTGNEPQAQKFAKEYHSLLSEEYRKPSDSPGSQKSNPDDKTKAYVNMIPQPLWYRKPPAKLPGELDRVGSGGKPLPDSLDTPVVESKNLAGTLPDIGAESMSLTPPSTSQSDHSRCNTSGSIPISPPEIGSDDHKARSPRSAINQPKTAARSRRKELDSRVSAYYPHVAARKGPKRTKPAKKSVSRTEIPPTPFPSTSFANEKPAKPLVGWSDVAKSAFEKLVSPIESPSKAESPLITHIVTPARPLDQRKAGLTEPESLRRKSSIFGGFIDSWKESKAEKRREELKKIIRYVT